jgi:LuxR family maltose regulon positive regulatory protein
VDSILGSRQPEGAARSSPLQQLPAPLSEQELRVLKLIVAGKSNQQIADELVISVGTAKWHVHNVLQKLGVSNRPQAIARARELGV